VSVEPKRLAAIFFVPRMVQDPTIAQLLEWAGATDIRPPATDDRSRFYDCHWAAMACKAYLDNQLYHHVLQIYFFQSEFFDLIEEHGGDAVVQAFTRTCEALKPDAAFFATHLDQAQRDRILSLEPLVLGKDANGLSDQRFGLLYLDRRIGQHLDHHPLRDDRDTIQTASGELFFAGRGDARWF